MLSDRFDRDTLEVHLTGSAQPECSSTTGVTLVVLGVVPVCSCNPGRKCNREQLGSCERCKTTWRTWH
eukprot:3753929-Prymnesium_polylepis.1